MCDPVSIGLTLAGTAMNMAAQSDAQSHEKHDIQNTEQQYSGYLNQSNDAFQNERTKQNNFFNQNTGTVADTLSKYSRPNVDQTLAGAQAARQAAYTAPINAMSFNAAPVADAAANSAVANRNAATGAAAKATSLGEAIAKANADAYGDVNTTLAGQAAENASKIAQTNIIANKQQQAGNVTQGNLNQSAQNVQNLLPAKLAADAQKGQLMRGLGQMFTTAGMLGSMSGGFGNLIGNAPVTMQGGAIPVTIPGSGASGALSKIGNVFS